MIKDGKRFWNVDEADRLLDERMESLQEVEGLLAEYTKHYDNEPGNYLLLQYVQQGPELVKRVEKARQTYNRLRAELKQEMSAASNL